MARTIEVEEGSGNVFAELGLPNPEEHLANARLAVPIAAIIRARRLTQASAACFLKIDQPMIFRLLRGAAHAIPDVAWPRCRDGDQARPAHCAWVAYVSLSPRDPWRDGPRAACGKPQNA